LDLLTFSRHPHEVGFTEAAWWSVFYIAVAIAFGLWVWWDSGSVFGTEYFTAYLVEKSLSIDNVFVFAIILTTFSVPSIYQQRVLLIGVILALIFRAIFIAIGAAALAYFAFTFFIFGAILIWTGIGLMRHWNEDPDPSENFVVRFVKRRVPFTETYHGTKLFVKENGVRLATPMFIVMIAIGSTDLLFALDSIPATFGVTQEAFLVFAANAFALLGLRALYFLVKGLLDRLIYLSLGLAFILIFIGVKLILLFGHEQISETFPKIDTGVSLLVIVAILTVATVASLIKSARDPDAVARAGRVTAPKEEPESSS
ncbi:MAG: TerC/Alx family metal homeostasis membrane protein, partial [Pontimonas sp.]